ncbi:MAG: hypothetical protein LBV74_19280 [Tannerella sp.]|jgi:hypothetical protein|nr:hypothetical protein [Tannerella sp.]
MESFKYLKEENGKYILKNQSVMNFCLGVGCIAIAGLIIIKNPSSIGAIAFAIIVAGLGVMILYGMKSQTVFEPSSRTVTFRNRNNATIYSFDDFQTFSMTKVKQVGITTNNMLYMVFEKNGKSMPHLIRQYGPVAKKAQQLYDEIESVMNSK